MLPTDATFDQCMEAIVALNDPDARQITNQWHDIANRDAVDQARLFALYGVDYQDTSAFDIVINTDGKQPAAVQAEILAAMANRPA